MLCPKCKNPIDNNAAVCEWCGANIPQQVLTIKSENNVYQNISFDAELIKTLQAGCYLSAVKDYKDRTGLGLKESKEYVDKLIAENRQILPNTTNTKFGGCGTVVIVIVFILGCLFLIINIFG